jgi:hypothetical protein
MATSKKATSENSSTKPNEPFYKKHAISLLLVVALLISILWGILSTQRSAKRYEKQIHEMTIRHTEMMDSMQIQQGELFISALSWATRSEMMRENLDQINNYFVEAIKNQNIEVIRIVNHSNGNVVLSTNKKDEGSTAEDEFIRNAKEISSRTEGNTVTFVAPIFGFNQQLGVLVIEKSK